MNPQQEALILDELRSAYVDLLARLAAQQLLIVEVVSAIVGTQPAAQTVASSFFERLMTQAAQLDASGRYDGLPHLGPQVAGSLVAGIHAEFGRIRNLVLERLVAGQTER